MRTWILIIVALAACSKPKSGESGEKGSSSSTPPPKPSLMSSEDFCNKLYKAIEDPLLGKCTDEDKRHEDYKLLSDFQVSGRAECKTIGENSRVAFDDKAAGRCLSGVASVMARGEGRNDQPHKNVPDCAKVMIGKQAEGAACKSGFECKEGLWCSGGKGVDGVCKKPSTGAGSECKIQDLSYLTPSPREPCATGFWCNFGDQCGALKPLGEKCVDTEFCDKGACVSGTCRGRGKAGEVCESSVHCTEFVLFCDKKSEKAGVCAPRAPAGAACKSDEGCQGVCADGKCKSFCGSG